MLEFNFEPFSEANRALQQHESQNSPADYSAPRSINVPMERNAPLSPNYYYSDYYPLNSLGSPVQSHFSYREHKEKSYWWLWLFPIVGILILIYFYKKEEIDAYFKEIFSSFFPPEKKEDIIEE